MALLENYKFTSADDAHTSVHGVKWTPSDGEVKAVIQLNHGMIEYIERYSEFAEYLADRGFVVMGHDHIGHGESVASPEEWGILHTKTPSDTLVEDMFTNYKIIKEQYPDKPFFILGHSMGSYLLRKFLCEKADSLSGVNGAIIMGTGTEADGAIKAGTMVVKLLAALHGRDYKSQFVVNLMYGAPYKMYDVTGADPTNSWLSTNVESVKKYYSDPKDTFMFSLNGYLILLESTCYDNNMDHIRKMNMDIPVMFASGAADPVGNHGVGVKAAHDKFKEAGVKDLTMKLYEGDRHEILQEMDRQKIFEDLYQWMSERM